MEIVSIYYISGSDSLKFDPGGRIQAIATLLWRILIVLVDYFCFSDKRSYCFEPPTSEWIGLRLAVYYFLYSFMRASVLSRPGGAIA